MIRLLLIYIKVPNYYLTTTQTPQQTFAMSTTLEQIAALEAQLEANPKLVKVAADRDLLTKSKKTRKPRKAPPAENRCMARVWGPAGHPNRGDGNHQCSAKRITHGDFSCFCLRHAKQATICEGPTWTGTTGKTPAGLKFGRIDQPAPWLDVNCPDGSVPVICTEWNTAAHKLLVSQHLEAGTARRHRNTKSKKKTKTKRTPPPKKTKPVSIRRKKLVLGTPQPDTATTTPPTAVDQTKSVEPQSSPEISSTDHSNQHETAQHSVEGKSIDLSTNDDDTDLDTLIAEAASGETNDDTDLDALIAEAAAQ